MRTGSVPRFASNTRAAPRATIALQRAWQPVSHRRETPLNGKPESISSQDCSDRCLRPILGHRGGPVRTPAFHGPGAEHPASPQTFTDLPWRRASTTWISAHSTQRGPGRLRTNVLPQDSSPDSSREGRLTHRSDLQREAPASTQDGGTERPEPQAPALEAQGAGDPARQKVQQQGRAGRQVVVKATVELSPATIARKK